MDLRTKVLPSHESLKNIFYDVFDIEKINQTIAYQAEVVFALWCFATFTYSFTHIYQGCVIGTLTILPRTQCPGSNPEKYEQINFMDLQVAFLLPEKSTNNYIHISQYIYIYFRVHVQLWYEKRVIVLTLMHPV